MIQKLREAIKLFATNWILFSSIVLTVWLPGSIYDITLQEIRIECLFPADEATEQSWKHA
jgi:hypothetical protein